MLMRQIMLAVFLVFCVLLLYITVYFTVYLHLLLPCASRLFAFVYFRATSRCTKRRCVTRFLPFAPANPLRVFGSRVRRCPIGGRAQNNRRSTVFLTSVDEKLSSHGRHFACERIASKIVQFREIVGSDVLFGW